MSQMPASMEELALEPLRQRLEGKLVGPHDDGWDAARTPWSLAVDQRPEAVVVAASTRDVVETVRFARETGLRVAPQTTGHNPGPLAPALEGTLLLKPSGLREVEIDPSRARARVGGGALWDEVVAPAYDHGLATLHGSSPDVGVAGYSLSGGIGWLARRYGLQCNSLTAVELVTADGELVRADEQTEAELFWALRGGGGGNFGVVTALEFDLYPVTEAYAGWLAWDWRHAERVLSRWAAWASSAPDEVTTSARILQLPPFPELPEAVRGRQLVMIDGAVLGDQDEAEALLLPLRSLRPEIDTFDTVPAPSLARLHLDPENPVHLASAHLMLHTLPREAVEAFVAAAGPGSGSTLLLAELRQLGGALARTPARHGALARLDDPFALFGAAVVPDADAARAGAASATRLAGALEPWSSKALYLNFAEHPVDTSSGFEPSTYRRLAEIKAQVDPDGLFRANHAIGEA
jgi:FAD binding domain/Berberine and berberine like